MELKQVKNQLLVMEAQAREFEQGKQVVEAKLVKQVQAYQELD